MINTSVGIDNYEMSLGQTLKEFEKHRTLGIFGDSRFPSLKYGHTVGDRAVFQRQMKTVLMEINPKVVYIIPTQGVCCSLLPLLQFLNIPFIIVNPYKGYFKKAPDSFRLNLTTYLQLSKSVITISENLETVEDQADAEEEAKQFIINNSENIISIYGDKSGDGTKELNKKLLADEENIIFINYSQIKQ